MAFKKNYLNEKKCRVLKYYKFSHESVIHKNFMEEINSYCDENEKKYVVQ